MAKKIPRPRVKSKKMHWLDKLFMGIGGLSPYFGKARLHQSMSKATESGRLARAAQRAAMIKKYGKGAMRVGRFAGLMNPWTAVPTALLLGAKHIVGKAFEPYMDPETLAGGSRENVGLFHSGTISKEGSARLLRERLAREERTRAVAAKRGELAWFEDPNFDFWGGGLKASKIADHPELAEKYNMNEGGIARLL